jgi:hypothetical protein
MVVHKRLPASSVIVWRLGGAKRRYQPTAGDGLTIRLPRATSSGDGFTVQHQRESALIKRIAIAFVRLLRL